MQRALLIGIAAALAASCAPAPDRPPDVILVTLDTTRADHLGLYGYERDTSPFLDTLAREALVFEEVRSTSSWTLPAHTSLFTGLWPHEHGVRYDVSGPLALEDAITEGARTYQDVPYRVRVLDAKTPTLAERLSQAGFETAAVVAGPWLMRPFGLDRGFEHYDDRDITSDVGRRANDVTDAAIGWLAQRDPERPCFLFLNYFDPHEPYAAPGSETEDPVAAYDEEIAFMDRELGRLFRYLRDEGLYDSALIVVTGDHGELLGERGRWGHGRWLDEPLLRVPLILKPPGCKEGHRSELPLQLSHVMHLISLAAVTRSPGDVARAAEELFGASPIHFAEVWPSPDEPELGRWVTVVDGRHKLLFSPTQGRFVLFDLVTDPTERVDLSSERPDVVEYLGAIYDDQGTVPPGQSIPVEGRALEALRALGYLGK